MLESVKKLDPSIFTKSGVMLGLGEQRLEVHQVMDDMRSASVDFITIDGGEVLMAGEFNHLRDVTDEQWDEVANSIKQANRASKSGS